MSMSAYFRALHDGYQSEIEDLTEDSDGANVLKQRLLEKRSQVAFLVQMIEASPEMVASVFHGTFHFESPEAMEKLLRLEADELPDWPELAHAAQLNPTGKELAKTFLQEPRGAWFLTVAAALEYLYQRPTTPHHVGLARHAHEAHANDSDEGHTRTRRAHDHDHGHDWDPDDDHGHAHDADHDEASQDWLEGQGFDRKE